MQVIDASARTRERSTECADSDDSRRPPDAGVLELPVAAERAEDEAG